MMYRKNGALGSRLTGAGWGGCAVLFIFVYQYQVHLVREENLDSFMKVLEEEYYRKHGFDDEQIRMGLFASKPSAGASFFTDLRF